MIFPTTSTTVLTASYYDNYQFITPLINNGNAGITTYSYQTGDITGQDALNSAFVTGLATGTKVNIVGTTNYLWSVKYYDPKYREIQNISTNYKSGIDRVTNLVDFVGKITNTKTTHTATLAGGNVSYSTARRLEYDHMGRLLKTWHTVNGATEVLLTNNEYNELGQLVDKKLYSADPASTQENQRKYKQSLDYRYNIRGWLSRINNSDVANSTNLAEDDANTRPDLFGMNLGYNEDLGTTNSAEYNGNISAIKWSTNLGLDVIKERAYNYSYDVMNRILSATHQQKSAAWGNSTAFHENNVSYDDNGNIKGLKRFDKTGALMDSLKYNYGTGNARGNQLLAVTDAGNGSQGFIDGNIAGTDYTYDANGNMTADKNKMITAITYNHLNLPNQVTKSSGDFIKYVYDASGRKLSQQVYKPSSVLKKEADYMGEFYYENDTLKFINNEEGRIVMPGCTSDYQ